MNSTEWRIIDRFKEPSSYGPLCAGLAALGIIIPAPWVQVISFAGAAICGALGILLREGGAQ